MKHSTRAFAARAALRALTLVAFCWTAFASPKSVRADTIVVNTTQETVATNGNCSIREAIQAANTDMAVDGCAAGAVGMDSIRFSIGSGAQDIDALTSTLVITTPVSIDGTSQPGFVSGSPGVPLIRISGALSLLIDFQAGSGGSSLSGLRVVNTRVGGLGTGVRVDDDVVNVVGNYFNTDGTSSLGGDDTVGVLIGTSTGSWVGGMGGSDRNLFGGITGVRVDEGTTNTISNNWFGVQASGSTALGSLAYSGFGINVGCNVLGSYSGQIIQDNVITGFNDGIALCASSFGNSISGNKIGVGADGTTRLHNITGIAVRGSDNNTIGDTPTPDRNVIAGNYYNIVLDVGSAAVPFQNTIQGNYIGIAADGQTRTSTYLNGTYDQTGISLQAADETTIGGTVDGSGNVISGNTTGVYVGSGVTDTVIRGNLVGTDATGSTAVIQAFGITVAAAVNIGDSSTPGNNVISGNDAGIFLTGSSGSTIDGNRIGLMDVGNYPLPNNYGINLAAGASALITNNWIAYNSFDGIFIDTTSTVAASSVGNCIEWNILHGVNSTNSGATADLEDNWWRNPTGPFHTGNPTGVGDESTDYVDYAPWLTKAPAACKRTNSDFDGDGKTDPAKFTASTGIATWIQSVSGLWETAALGLDATEYVRRSDFDGDGRADPGKYVDASDAIWYNGSLGGSYGVYMGSDVAALVPGSDFDGDGSTDPAKYVAAGAVWYRASSNLAWVGTYIGADAAPALPGSDYDGDGKTDLAKYVAAGAIWYFGSSDSAWHGAYIGADGVPVPASDFDGDGITDMGKYLTGTNTLWYRRSSDLTWVGNYLGPGTFIYVPAADFDGDGNTDPTKFDTGTQTLWWLKSSTSLWDGVWMGPGTYSIVN